MEPKLKDFIFEILGTTCQQCGRVAPHGLTEGMSIRGKDNSPRPTGANYNEYMATVYGSLLRNPANFKVWCMACVFESPAIAKRSGE